MGQPWIGSWTFGVLIHAETFILTNPSSLVVESCIEDACIKQWLPLIKWSVKDTIISLLITLRAQQYGRNYSASS